MRLLDRRINELCAIGTETRMGCRRCDELEYGNARPSRHSSLTDGTYRFSDYIEKMSGVCPHPQESTRRCDEARLIIWRLLRRCWQHSTLAVPEAGPTRSRRGSLITFVVHMEPGIAINGGIVRPITAYAPSGTVLNAEFPAAMGNR